MTLNEIVQEVIKLTSRPDQEDFIRRQVRASITEIHNGAKFPRDRVEEVFQLEGPTTLIKLTLPPRFKKFEVLGAVTDTGVPIRLTTSNGQYTRVDPAGLFSESFASKQDVYYVAGAVLNIRSSVGASNIYALYSANPEVADNELETWIMALQSSLVTDLTLSKVQGQFGRSAESKDARARFQVAMQDFVFLNLVEGDN